MASAGRSGWVRRDYSFVKPAGTSNKAASLAPRVRMSPRSVNIDAPPLTGPAEVVGAPPLSAKSVQTKSLSAGGVTLPFWWVVTVGLQPGCWEARAGEGPDRIILRPGLSLSGGAMLEAYSTIVASNVPSWQEPVDCEDTILRSWV